MQDPGAIILTAVLFLVFLSFTIFLRHKQAVLRHQERMMAIEKGAALPMEISRLPATPRLYLLKGLLWLCAGLSILVVLAILSITASKPINTIGRMQDVQRLKEAGATETQVQQYLAEAERERRGLPLGVASLGLIPASVGIAYLLFYKKETEVPSETRG